MAHTHTHSDAKCKGAGVTVSNGQTAVDFSGTNFQNSLSSYSCVGECYPTRENTIIHIANVPSNSVIVMDMSDSTHVGLHRYNETKLEFYFFLRSVL